MAEAVIIAVSILVLAAVLAYQARPHRDELRDLVGKKVVVQLEDATMVGTLASAGRDLVKITHATAGVDRAQPVDGHLRIARSSIRYVQAVGD